MLAIMEVKSYAKEETGRRLELLVTDLGINMQGEGDRAQRTDVLYKQES